jgi:Flp pilus assembly protein TadG
VKTRQPLRERLRNGLGKRSAFAVEFSIVAPIFLLLLFVVFEVAYDLFLQEVLDSSLAITARQVQVGNTQGASASNFVSTYFCPNDGGLLNCNNLYVRIEEVTLQGTSTCDDFYDATSGSAPIVNGTLELGYYYNGAGQQGTGGNVGPTVCETAGSNTSFNNAGASQCIVMSAVYVAPSFLNGLVLNRITYNGHLVRTQFSTAAFITEPFTATALTPTC